MAMSFSRRWISHPFFYFAVLLCLVAAVYSPGLRGGFVFDDEVNILQNPTLKIDQLSAKSLEAAAFSGGAGPLGRPIALLSFALNLFATGGNPYYFKFTNLVIHLANTLLVGVVAQTLARSSQRSAANRWPALVPWIGLLTASMWGLHPLNLTSVLYVVQRMTSLSTFFGLIALVTYSTLRVRQTESHATGSGWRDVLNFVSIGALLLASVFTKESGILFLPLILWIEYTVFQFSASGAPIKIGILRLKSLTSISLALIAAYALFFVVPRMVGSGSYANRDFTLVERALTEPRVLFYYLRQVIWPRASELSLYHDDFLISETFVSPFTTATDILGLVVVSAASVALRKRAPALLFAWGWFLISHALESTIFPLELVHEHRNYFATIGIFLALALALQRVPARWRKLSLAAVGVYLALCTAVTVTRALQWSDPVDLALVEASNHPKSARANYELGRTFLALFETTGESRFGELAEGALRDASKSYKPGLGPYFGLIQTAYYRKLEPDRETIDALKNGLQSGPTYNGNTSFLNSFLLCQIDRRCTMMDADAVGIFQAALANPRLSTQSKAEIYKMLAQYYIDREQDLLKGTELIVSSIQTYDSAASRIMLAQVKAMGGDLSAAEEQLKLARAMDRNGVYAQRIDKEQAALQRAKTP